MGNLVPGERISSQRGHSSHIAQEGVSCEFFAQQCLFEIKSPVLAGSHYNRRRSAMPALLLDELIPRII